MAKFIKVVRFGTDEFMLINMDLVEIVVNKEGHADLRYDVGNIEITDTVEQVQEKLR